MSFYDASRIPTFDPAEHDERIQARLTESMQYRLQQQINLKNDEISRLKSDLSILKGEIETLSDTFKYQQKPQSQAQENLRKQIHQAKSEIGLKMQQMKMEHSKVLQQIDQEHQEEVSSLRNNLERSLFLYSEKNKISSKKSRNSRNMKHSSRTRLNDEKNDHFTIEDENDHVDNFLESLKTTKTIAQEKMKKKDYPKKIITEAELEMNDRKIDQYNEIISEMKRKKEEIKSKIKDVSQSISDISQFPNDYDDDYENDTDSELDDQDDELTQTFSDKVNKCQKKLASMQKSLAPKLNKLKQKIQIEQEKARDKKKQIEERKKLNDKINQKIHAMKQKRQKEEELRKAKLEKENRARYQDTLKMLETMTPKQKEMHCQGLMVENQSLKREIFRLDSMIYGKSGKYHIWKDI